ncbi:MAG: class II fumarate hydratase [Deltaproteobacteria bacterium]|nr:class II fumarate hydratase [Deltaproteobacteria bacterium]
METGRRKEEDALGVVFVPEEAYYGAQTQRAVENFPVSGLKFPPVFIRCLGLIKKHAAAVNGELGLLDTRLAQAIVSAAHEVAEGGYVDQFVLDVFQTGSGTSTNMNANEVIAGRANEILTGKRGGKFPVHPNDHVNLGQSSNDVIPSTIHISAVLGIRDDLLPGLEALRHVLVEKSREFSGVVKIGRTHLQDAVPISLGREFGAYGTQIQEGMRRLKRTLGGLSSLALGGTAVGNGLNTHPSFAQGVIRLLSRETEWDFREAEDHFQAQASMDAVVEASGALRSVAVSLSKIANDIRWLASGPRCGLGEIEIPSLQPGSSIMPGKVNPVIPEVILQVSAQVMGNDLSIALGGQGGIFELNTMMPLMAYNLLQSIQLIASGARLFATKCVEGITANEERCRSLIEGSLALSTYLVPLLGYDGAASIAEEAHRTGRTIRQVLLSRGIMGEDAIDALFQQIYSEG